jgi:hypothetical protein
MRSIPEEAAGAAMALGGMHGWNRRVKR